jgi:multiple sugar transport system ATP-binding protein
MASVTLNKLCKTYPGGVRAVIDVDMEIKDREFIVLVGPSGCGKSTALRMIAGLEEITAGTISIGDRVVNGLQPKDRDIAMVFQNYALYPHMTVFKNLSFSLNLRRRELGLDKPQIDAKVRQVAAMLGIEDLLERRPNALSGGQRQRVAVGRALVRSPKVFLFDEPLSNLDAKLRVEMRSEIKRLQRRVATTTVYVTHDQEEAMTLGDRVVVMKAGIVQQSAPPMEIYDFPANRFVAGFVGTPPMNFLEGRVSRTDGPLVFESGSVRISLGADLSTQLAAHVDKSIVIGIRPDFFSVETTGGAASEARGAIRAKVVLVEPLGDRKDVSAVTQSGQHLLARVDSRSAVQEGQEISLHFDFKRMHFFEANEAGVRIPV